MDNNNPKLASIQDVRYYASQHGISVLEAEIAMLKDGVIPKRYLGTVRFAGAEGQARLLESKALVLGCGGLGGTLIEILARVGIGRLVLIDFDKFDETNLNRQLLCRESDVGRYKAERAKERVQSINSAINVEISTQKIDKSNINPLLVGCDIAIDALDNGATRIILEEACLDRGIPLVHGALGNASFQVSAIRRQKMLSNLYANAGVAQTGTPTPTVIACAALQAAEAVKIITGMGDVLDNKLLLYDWMNNAYDTISFD